VRWASGLGFSVASQGPDAGTTISGLGCDIVVRRGRDGRYEVVNAARELLLRVNDVDDAWQLATMCLGEVHRLNDGFSTVRLEPSRLPRLGDDFEIAGTASHRVVTTPDGRTRVELEHLSGGEVELLGRDAITNLPVMMGLLSVSPGRLRDSYVDPKGRPLVRAPWAKRLVTVAAVSLVLMMTVTAIVNAVAGLGDSHLTFVLFLVLIPCALIFSVAMGMIGYALSDSLPRSNLQRAAIYFAALGPTLGTVVINVVALLMANAIEGSTSLIPVLAGAASAVWGYGIVTLVSWRLDA
jgi:hypothetical protein